MAGFLHDLRYAARAIRRSRGFFAVVVLTLGFGIGVNTATFSIVNAVLIRPWGYADPDRLVALHERLRVEPIAFSPADIVDLQQMQQSFTAMAAYVTRPYELSGTGDGMRIDGARVTAGLFTLLGVEPAHGRSFAREDERPDPDVAIVSWGLWQRRFNGDPRIVGQTIHLDRRPYTVVGVMPAAFQFPRRGPRQNNVPADVWVPLGFSEQQRAARATSYTYGVVARLKDDVTPGAAQSAMNAIAPRIQANYPAALFRNNNFSVGLDVVPLHEEVAGRVAQPLLLLLGAVGLVLLVACANVANLVLSRAAARGREIGVRRALGATDRHLLRLLLAEALLLAAAGGAAGVALAALAVNAIPTVLARSLPGLQEVALDTRVLAFTAAVSIVTALAFAIVPLVGVERHAGAPRQDESGRATAGIRRRRFQSGLVVATVGLAAVLLVGAGLFVRSFSALIATDTGFRPGQVLTASLTLPTAGYPNAASVRSFHASLYSRLAALPGARSASLSTDLPLEIYEQRAFSPERTSARGQPVTTLSWTHGRYFETFGIRLTRGRAFTDAEHADVRAVVIVNERLARSMWPGEDPIGKRLKWGIAASRAPWLTVVGVVADVADGPLGTEPSIHAYEPFRQFFDFSLDNASGPYGRDVKAAIRADGNPLALAGLLRREIGAVDARLAIERIAVMDERLRDTTAPRRFTMLVVGGFAVGALLLAATGLYGLLAYSVAQRRREIAVRLALGAERQTVVRMIVRQGLTLVGTGLAAGLATSWALTRFVEAFLYRTNARDAATFAAVAATLTIVALAACALPSWRAARMQPVSALRAE